MFYVLHYEYMELSDPYIEFPVEYYRIFFLLELRRNRELSYASVLPASPLGVVSSSVGRLGALGASRERFYLR